MTGLISIPAAQPPGAQITNDGWFPNIGLDDVRATERLTTSISPERLRWAIVNAILTVNKDLADWREQQTAASMADIPASQVNGESRLISLYKRAVYSYAHADLIERYPDYSITEAGARRSEALAPAGDDHYRNARWAIRDLLGITRSTVELI
ncbi:head completion/stabilization protein [Perlucidibaca piscinae]|uniref:head completion/stabilization protein n=1 Tax=Perlucidibaca piscinae TaxID=392589 RepID=UPI0003B5DA47|nr:head completion/stabilization protein [Perlucidibaca piscinae]